MPLFGLPSANIPWSHPRLGTGDTELCERQSRRGRCVETGGDREMKKRLGAGEGGYTKRTLRYHPSIQPASWVLVTPSLW